MKQDEIIEMARQAGIENNQYMIYEALAHTAFVCAVEELEAFARLVAAKEREACESIEYDLAKSPAMFATMAEYKSYRDGVEKYREAIRARGEA